VYNVKGHTAVAVVQGTHLQFFSDEELYTNEQAMLFHIRHHWWRLGIEEELFCSVDSITNRLVNIDGYAFSMLDSKADPRIDLVSTRDSIDVLIILSVAPKKVEQLAVVRATHILASTALSNNAKIRLSERLKTDHRFVELNRGAFILKP
jgi:hypothetical protein